MKPFAYRPVRKRRHRELFALSFVMFVLGAFVLDGGLRGLVVFASLIVFYLAIMHRLSGEDTRGAERSGMFLGG